MCRDVRSALGTIFSGLFTVHDPTRGSGHRIFHNLTGRVGSGQEVFKMSRVDSGRLGSDLGVFKLRVGSGRI